MNSIIKTSDQIKADMLKNIDDSYEKSEGFLTGDLVRSSSIEIANLYEAISGIMDKVDVNALDGEDLTRFVYQRRGIIRKKGTKAKVLLVVSGNGTISKGDLFSTKNNIIFESVESKTIDGSGAVLAQCTISGVIGMVGAGSVVQFPVTIKGINEVSNFAPSFDGFHEESDESLRERYYEDLEKPATSNNIYHYMLWAKSVAGVGDAKVFPTWNGKNTVKVLIVDSDKQPASSNLVEEVQNYIDPSDADRWGKGHGQSAIGSFCTVESAHGKSIVIEASIVKENGYLEEMVVKSVSDNIKEYFGTVALKSDYISHAKITSLILTSEGVQDASDIKVNSSLTGNIDLLENEVPILSELRFV